MDSTPSLYTVNITSVNATVPEVSPLSSECAASKSIADDQGFRVLLFLELFVAFVAVFLNGLVLWIIPHVGVFHVNLRLILAYMSLNLLIYSTACSVKEMIMLHEIYTLDIPKPDCRLVSKAFECKLQELTNTIPIGNVVYTSLVLVIERMYSTVRYRRYDQDHNGPWLSISLISVALIPVLWSQLSGLLGIARDKTVPVCESLISMTASGAMGVLALNLSAEVLSVAMALQLYVWNNHKLKAAAANRAKHTLSSRFQISQNVQVNSLVLPSMLFQSFCYLPNYLFLLVVIVGLPFSPSTKAWLLHVNYLWKLVYAIAHPLLAIKRNVHIMEQLRKRAPQGLVRAFGLGGSGKVTPIVTITAVSRRVDAHFEVMEQIWDQQKQPRPVSPRPVSRERMNSSIYGYDSGVHFGDVKRIPSPSASAH